MTSAREARSRERPGLARKILAGVGALLAGNLAASLTAMVSSMVLARAIGVADYGRYSLVFLYASLFQGLASFGLDDVLTRELSRSRQPAERLLGNAILLRLGFSAVAVVACVAVAAWGEPDRELAWGLVFAVSPLLLSALYVPLWSVLAARMEFPLREAIVVASRVAEVALVVVFALAGARFLALVAVTAAAQTVPLLLTLWLVHGRARPGVRYDSQTVRALLAQSAPLGFASVVALVYSRVDGVLLGRLVGYEAVGLYSAAYKFLNLALALPYVVNAAVFPLLARVEEDPVTAQRVFQRTVDYLVVVALPLAVGATFLAPSVVELVYGAGFTPAAEPLRVLLWAAGVLFVGRTCRQLLVAAGLQGTHLALLVGGAVTNVALNLWWIPRWGMVGAAWATLCAEATVLAAGYTVVRNRLGMRLHLGFALRAGVSALAMGAASTATAALGPWAAVSLGGSVYLLSTALLGLWPHHARALLRQAWLRAGAS